MISTDKSTAKRKSHRSAGRRPSFVSVDFRGPVSCLLVDVGSESTTREMTLKYQGIRTQLTSASFFRFC